VRALTRRLTALEATQPASAQDKARGARFVLAGRALFDAVEADDDSPSSFKRAESGRLFVLALVTRLDAGTETDRDRAMLAALPVCHLPPQTLVRALCAFHQGHRVLDAPRPR
jgi:hypothetical protein